MREIHKCVVHMLLPAALISIASGVSAQGPQIAYCYSTDPDRTLMTVPFKTNITPISQLHEVWYAHAADAYGLRNAYFLGCNSYADEQSVQRQMESTRAYIRASNRQAPSIITWQPSSDVERRFSKASAKSARGTEVSADLSKDRDSDKQSSTVHAVKPAPTYVEVAGPNGIIHLSPEVAARNEAAAADYKRRLAEYERKVAEVERANQEKARIKAEQEAKAGAVMEAFRRQSEAHAELMRKHQQDTADHQAKLGLTSGAAENLGLRKFQATSPIRASREEAMRALSAPNGQKLSDIQCAEIKGFANEWRCWGFYLQETTRSGVSKQ